MSDVPALPSLEETLSISGLEFMQGVKEGRLPRAPIADIMNFTLHSVEQGRVVFRGTPEAQHCNPMGGVHGGWYGTILDSALGCVVMTMVPKGRVYTTLEYKVNITRALRPGTLVECIGISDHAGRSTAVAHGEIRGVEDSPITGADGNREFLIHARKG